MVRSGLDKYFSIEHVISYENLQNYDQLESKFKACDVLVIQPIEQYEKFKLENLKKIVKGTCRIVVVPFVRFEGFWFEKDLRELKKLAAPAVMFFPKLDDSSEVESYISRNDLSEEAIHSNFARALDKLKAIEQSGNILFYDFVVNNYKDIPLFRDAYHPTNPFYMHIGLQIIDLIADKFELSVDIKKPEIQLTCAKEYGHFKPIIDKVAKVLGLNYDLDSYFVYSRHEYLEGVVLYEVEGEAVIKDLNELKVYLDSRRKHAQVNT